MKTFILIILFIFSAFSLFAQKRVVVCDSTVNEPVEIARVLGSGQKGKTMFLLLSDSLGVINVPSEKMDSVKSIRVERIGYKVLHLKLGASESFPDTLFLEPGNRLHEALVVARRKLYKLAPDKVVYDVAGDSSMQDKTAFEALMHTPLLMVKRSGEVNAVGDKRLEYRLNGLRNPLLSGNIHQALSALPANLIKRIEVKTEYSVEDNGVMIVNFVAKGKIEGFLSNFYSELNDDRWSKGARVLTAIKKFTLSTSYSNPWVFSHSSSRTVDEYRYTSANLYRYRRKYTDDGYRMIGHNVEVNASYDIDDQTILSVYGRALMKVNPRNSASEYGVITNNRGEQTAEYNKSNSQKLDDTEYTASVDFERKFGKNSENGSFYVGYEYYSRPTNSYTREQYAMESSGLGSLNFAEGFFDYDQSFRKLVNWHTVETSYWRRFNKSHNIEFAAKARYRDEGEKTTQYNHYKFAPTPFEDTDSSSFAHSQIYGEGFLRYKFSKGPFAATSGAAVQCVNEHINRRHLQDKFQTTSVGFLPFASVAYRVSDLFSGGVAYSLSKSFPDVSALNPYIDRTQPGRIYYGNTRLKPEQTHKIELSTDFNFSKVYAHLAFTNLFSDNLILEHRFLENDILHITKDNIARRYQFEVNAYASSKITRTTFVKINSYLTYARYWASAKNLHNSGCHLRVDGGVSQELPFNLNLDLNGGFNTAYIYLEGKGGENYYYDVSLSRSFLKDNKLSIYLKASNFFPIHNTRGYNYESDGYFSRQVNRNYHASFGFHVRYSFGKLKIRVKKTERSISNDDVKQNYDE